jgi:hypothetical protein
MKDELTRSRGRQRGAMAAGCGEWAPIALSWGEPRKLVTSNGAALLVVSPKPSVSAIPVPVVPETEHA